MKTMKRLAGILLAVAILLAMTLPAFAADEDSATGSILIKDSETILASEKTFAAYKILDLVTMQDAEGNVVYIYSVPEAMKAFFAERYGHDDSKDEFAAQVVVSIREEDDMFAFAAAALEAAKTNGVQPAEDGEAVSNGYLFSDLPLGYYVIDDTTVQGDFIRPVSALILDTVTPNVEVKVKAEKPPVGKKIDEDGNLETTEDRVETNQAAIGDTVTYVITSKVPDMTGYDKYFFIARDHMSKGLTYANNMQIKIGDTVLTAGEDYEVTPTENEDGTTDLKIVFKNFIRYNTPDYIGKPIEITYTATLNKDAELFTEPNTNEVYIQYSNNPKVEYEGADEPTPEDLVKEPLGETPKAEVETFTTAIEIVKTDPMGNRLEGATFTLEGVSMNIVRVERDTFAEAAEGAYWKLIDGSYTLTDPTEEGIDQSKYDSLTTKYSKTTVVEYVETTAENKKITATVSEDGTVRFEGLGVGEYTITETKAPEGFNPLDEEITITVTWNAETNSFEYTGANLVDGIARVTVINQEGTVLPSTGGIGTTLFYVVGGILFLAAIVLLVSRKRMSQNG